MRSVVKLRLFTTRSYTSSMYQVGISSSRLATTPNAPERRKYGRSDASASRTSRDAPGIEPALAFRFSEGCMAFLDHHVFGQVARGQCRLGLGRFGGLFVRESER